MKTYKAVRPPQDYIDEMVRLAQISNRRQIDILLLNGYTFTYVPLKHRIDKKQFHGSEGVFKRGDLYVVRKRIKGAKHVQTISYHTTKKEAEESLTKS